jgi:hypothetical protein
LCRFETKRRENRKIMEMARHVPEKPGKYSPVTIPHMRASRRGIRGLA